MGDVDNGGGYAMHVWGRGYMEKSLKLPLNFAVNRKLPLRYEVFHKKEMNKQLNCKKLDIFISNSEQKTKTS